MIGGGGLIGSHVVLAFAGARLVVTRHENPVPGSIFLDITDAPKTNALIRDVDPEVVVLAAAEPFVERCEREPDATRAINVEAARTIAEAARDRSALLVVFSSEYVFDGRLGRYVEGDAVRPINEYGRQKVELEAIARSVPRHLICRTSGVFGWEQTRTNFVCQLIDHLRAGRGFVVPSDQVITPTYAPDLAQTLVTLIALEVTGTIHLVGPRILPRSEFAAMIREAFGLPDKLVATKATSELGLSAPRPRGAGLADDRLRNTLGGPLPDLMSALAHRRASENAAARD